MPFSEREGSTVAKASVIPAVESNNATPQGVDKNLEILVRLVEAGGAPCPVRLAVGDLLVSGRLVSSTQYQEALKAYYVEHVLETPAADGVLQNAFDLGAQSVDALSAHPVFAHLVDAQATGVGATIPEGGFWRVPLSEVSGFGLGHAFPMTPTTLDDAEPPVIGEPISTPRHG